MNPKGFFLAGALMLVPAIAGASSHASRHPANPGAATDEPAFSSPFEAAVPLLDRDAPHPSYGPVPEGAVSDEVTPAPAVDHSTMDHGSMGHGAMQQQAN